MKNNNTPLSQSTQIDSIHTELPYSYRSVDYCSPEKEINYAENLGKCVHYFISLHLLYTSYRVEDASPAYLSAWQFQALPLVIQFGLGFCALGSLNIGHYVLTSSAVNLVQTATQTVTLKALSAGSTVWYSFLVMLPMCANDKHIPSLDLNLQSIKQPVQSLGFFYL